MQLACSPLEQLDNLVIRPPAQPAAAGGLGLWRQLAPLLSAQPTFAGGRPPVGFEVVTRPGATSVGLWVARSLPAGAVARAVATAWPGATTTITRPPQLATRRNKHRGGEHRREAGLRHSAGRVRFTSGEWFPLGPAQHTSTTIGGSLSAGGTGLDPLRGLLEALTDLPPGATGMLQILARPARGARLARARRPASHIRAGTPPRRLTGRLPSPASAVRGRPAAAAGPTDPFALDDARAISRKLTDPPLFQVTIRMAISGPAGRAGRRARRGWLRQLTAALGLYGGRNQLIIGPQHRAVATLNARHLGRGLLLSASELAALAHLPAEPSRHGLATAAARSIAPPAGLAHD